ncbi:extracellular solute-binding protein [Paenibacillus sacheonensis]|uniref:Extracellular solute-binding protein n=1 Tax=Paenibacillus sacheonensis TaxID=742054 RepID=A0A7X5BZN9_9BACL|nr:extracellular solute-binding protein [Paenibacillus sacheonensis]MBM7567821.1 putative aldouronate transport system substrate-binding protein [Paenibacillus sacheonensis]NBC70711.1 extracellular solute-binding protein [Paenibacillus sacheonensis]
MRNYKRLGMVTAIVVLLVAMMAACSSGNNGNGGSNGNQDANAGNQAANGENAASGDASKPELKRLDVWQNEDYNTYPVAKMLEDKTGYKVKYDMLPQDKPSEKLNLIMSSGEPYDLVSASSDMALYSDYAQKGALVDLLPLIDKYGPNIKAAISQPSIDALKVDGKLYAIPTAVTYAVNSSILIRMDWLEKLGLQMPTTTEELTTVLKAFKDKDPGSNGNQNVPLTIRGDLPMLDNIVGAFGLPNAWNDVDGKLVPRVLDPAYKDYIAYMSDLYKQGLLDKEFVVNKDATAKEKFSSGKAGAIIVHWADIPTISDAIAKTAPDAKFAFVPALKGPAGKAGFAANSGFDRLTFIPKASKHPEDAIKWINASLDPETFKDLAIGEEGKHFKFENGAYTPILPIFTDERNLANNYMAGTDETNYPLYWQARVRKSPVMFEAFDFLNNKQPDNVKIPNKLGLAPFMPEYAKDNLQLESMVGDYTIKLIAGAESLSGLEAFQAKYKAAGEEASAKEINDWYAATK